MGPPIAGDHRRPSRPSAAATVKLLEEEPRGASENERDLRNGDGGVGAGAAKVGADAFGGDDVAKNAGRPAPEKDGATKETPKKAKRGAAKSAVRRREAMKMAAADSEVVDLSATSKQQQVFELSIFTDKSRERAIVLSSLWAVTKMWWKM